MVATWARSGPGSRGECRWRASVRRADVPDRRADGAVRIGRV